MTTPMVLDCDPGIDDAVAIAYAVTHPDIELIAVGSVWGNVDIDQTTRNALHVLDQFGAHTVPVARGATGPIAGSTTPESGRVHGTDGLGGTAPARSPRSESGEPAAEQLVRICRDRPGEVTVVAVGPMTNLALALELDPGLPDVVGGVTVMGGAALAPGNATHDRGQHLVRPHSRSSGVRRPLATHGGPLGCDDAASNGRHPP